MTDKAAPESVADVIAEVRARRGDHDSEEECPCTYEDVDLDLSRIEAALERERAEWREKVLALSDEILRQRADTEAGKRGLYATWRELGEWAARLREIASEGMK